jgi:hypothetical protein
MNKLKALLRMDPVTGVMCAMVILLCAAVDTSVLAVTPQPNPSCPHYKAWLMQAAQTGTNCMGDIPNECICPAACGVKLCKP